MRFLVVDRGVPVQASGYGEPHVVLRRNAWDDFGYKTMFEATLYAEQVSYNLGAVKIFSESQTSGYTAIDSSFEYLDQTYCSVGQDPEYYEILGKGTLSSTIADDYLRGIRDAAYDPQIENDFAQFDGWRTSLFRFGQASNALEVGKRIFRASAVQKVDGVLSFSFSWERDFGSLDFDFQFDDSDLLPGRCNALIGYNGVGKTTLLADLAVATSRVGLSKQDATANFIAGEDTSFGSVIAVSYSAFDTFVTPRSDQHGDTSRFGYVYCGLRNVEADDDDGQSTFDSRDGLQSDRDASDPAIRLKGIDEIEEEFAVALDRAGRRAERNYFLTALDELAKEPSFGRAGVDLRHLASNQSSAQLIVDFNKLSTGHKIVLNIVAQLAAHLRQRSLVLIDEPETHLHPPLMAALLRAVQGLLRDHDSFAIIATHSPVVVQEIPSKFIRILERVGDDVSHRSPEIETFGESIGTITRHVFSLDSSSTDFQAVLAELADNFSVNEIEELFDNRLASQARAFILNYKNRRI